MKSLVLFFAFLFSMQSFALTAVAPSIPNLVRIGSATGADTTSFSLSKADLANLIVLQAGSGATTTATFLMFQKAGATTQAQYQVTAGKKFYVVAAYGTGSATGSGILISSTAALLSDGTGTAPTGLICYSGSCGASQFGVGSSPYLEVPLPNLIGNYFPAGTFVGMKWLGAAGQVLSVTLYGYEM